MHILTICLLLSFGITQTTYSMNQMPEEKSKKKSKKLLRTLSTKEIKKSLTRRSSSEPTIDTPRTYEPITRNNSENDISELVPQLNLLHLGTTEQPLKGPRRYDLIDTPPLITLIKAEVVNEQNLQQIVPNLSYDEINAVDEQGNTALIWAIRKQNPYIARLILTNPYTDINHQNKSKYTPLHYAVWIGNIKIIQLLLTCPNLLPNIKNAENYTPLHCASKMDLLEIIETLIRDPRVTLNIYDIDEDKPRATFTVFDIDEKNRSNKIKCGNTPHDLIPRSLINLEEAEQTIFRKMVFARYTIDLTIDEYLDERLTLKKIFWGSPIVLETEEIDEIVELVKLKTHDCWVDKLDYVNDIFITHMIIARYKGITPIRTVKQLSFWQ